MHRASPVRAAGARQKGDAAMLRTIFAGLDRAGALMLERQSTPQRLATGFRSGRPLPSCEFDYEYYGSIQNRVRRGI